MLARMSVVSSLLGMLGCVTGPRLREGQALPAFSAVAHDGSTISPEVYRNRWLVLWFYPKANTTG